MTLFEAACFGLVQGLGEFLPISSSAHLVVLPWAAGWEDPGLAFDVALHLGTLVALVVYFRQDLLKLVMAALRSLGERRIAGAPDEAERRLAWLVVLGSIPGAAIGFLLEHKAEDAFRAKWIVAAAMIAMGLLLFVADRFAPARRKLETIGVKDALLIGLSQALAIIPGVSRSGSTISCGRALSLDREAAARFSFLLAVPIVAGAGLLKVPKLLKAGGGSTELLVGMIVAAVSGYLAIDVLLRFVRARSYLPFVVYRVLFGAAVLAAIALRLRPIY